MRQDCCIHSIMDGSRMVFSIITHCQQGRLRTSKPHLVIVFCNVIYFVIPPSKPLSSIITTYTHSYKTCQRISYRKHIGRRYTMLSLREINEWCTVEARVVMCYTGSRMGQYLRVSKFFPEQDGSDRAGASCRLPTGVRICLERLDVWYSSKLHRVKTFEVKPSFFPSLYRMKCVTRRVAINLK